MPNLHGSNINLFIVTVIVLDEVDKATENVQHLIKWIMDCYSQACKIIICCEDDSDIIDSIKSRCKIIPVVAPATHEVSFCSALLLCSNYSI